MKKWLFNPFEFIAGWMSIFLGIAILLITALLCFYGDIHLDGVIDLHLHTQSDFSIALAEGLVNWMSMAIFIYASGLIFSKSSIRMIDVFGTQAMARFPMLLAAAVSLLLPENKVVLYFEYEFLKTGVPVDPGNKDIVFFALITLTTILMLIWMISLMYKAYSVACNIKGTTAVLSFTACVIFAEILSKTIINLIILQ